jgi:hypothetical protein
MRFQSPGDKRESRYKSPGEERYQSPDWACGKPLKFPTRTRMAENEALESE